MVKHKDLKLRYGTPPPSSIRSSTPRSINSTIYHLNKLMKDRHLRAEAKARTPDIMAAVSARYEEIRHEIDEAAAQHTPVGARKTQILYEIEKDFVRKWGYSTDTKVFRANVKSTLIKHLYLARRWEDAINKARNDPERVKKLVGEFARVSALSSTELRIYERTMGIRDIEEDEEDVMLSRSQSSSSQSRGGGRRSVGGESRGCRCLCGLSENIVKIVAIVVFLLLLIVPGLYLCVFATAVGRKQSINWLISSLFMIFIIFLLAFPLQIFLVNVVLPSLINDKLQHNPRLNSASYPFSTPLPGDALDFLLEIKPSLYQIVAESEDPFVSQLREMKDHKRELPLEILEEIHSDMRWRRWTTVAVGIFFAGVLVTLPEVAQETLFAEISLLAPIATFYLLLGAVGEEGWNSAILALVTIVIAGAVVVGLTSLVAYLHDDHLRQRDARLKKKREHTQSLIEADPFVEPLNFDDLSDDDDGNYVASLPRPTLPNTGEDDSDEEQPTAFVISHDNDGDVAWKHKTNVWEYSDDEEVDEEIKEVTFREQEDAKEE